MMSGAGDAISTFERVLRNDKLVALAGIAFVVLLAWGYLLAGAGIDMSIAGMYGSYALVG
jgi:hypothetical protein